MATTKSSKSIFEQLEEKLKSGNPETNDLLKYSELLSLALEKTKYRLEISRKKYYEIDDDSSSKSELLLNKISYHQEQIRIYTDQLDEVKSKINDKIKSKINNTPNSGNSIVFNGSVNIRPSKNKAVNYITKEQKEKDIKAQAKKGN